MKAFRLDLTIAIATPVALLVRRDGRGSWIEDICAWSSGGRVEERVVRSKAVNVQVVFPLLSVLPLATLNGKVQGSQQHVHLINCDQGSIVFHKALYQQVPFAIFVAGAQENRMSVPL